MKGVENLFAASRTGTCCIAMRHNLYRDATNNPTTPAHPVRPNPRTQPGQPIRPTPESFIFAV